MFLKTIGPDSMQKIFLEEIVKNTGLKKYNPLLRN
jgi:hypothetical protein